MKANPQRNHNLVPQHAVPVGPPPAMRTDIQIQNCPHVNATHTMAAVHRRLYLLLYQQIIQQISVGGDTTSFRTSLGRSSTLHRTVPLQPDPRSQPRSAGRRRHPPPSTLPNTAGQRNCP